MRLFPPRRTLPNDIRVRAMAPRDRKAVLGLILDAHDYHRRSLKGELRTVRPESSEAVFARLLALPNSVYFVAEAGRRVVGYVHCELRTQPAGPTTRGRSYGYVNTLAIATDYRRRGVGRTLMELVREWAFGQEISEIELNVFDFNQAAVELYESLGYRTVSRRMRFEL
jgi:ribosomal protein S18 acetylase RimI-like enzyme